MANTGGTHLTIRAFLVLGVACLLLTNIVDAKDKSKKRPDPGREKGDDSTPDGGDGGGGGGPQGVYDVRKFGAKSDGKTSNEMVRNCSTINLKYD